VKILVTGATGFVGRHVVNQFVTSGHNVVAMARDKVHARTLPWFEYVEFVTHDLHKSAWDWSSFTIPDILIHLAWPGLPNYQDYLHISKNMHSDLSFIEAAVQAGVPHIIVAGTCLEYGIQHGPLREEMETYPITPYGFAKDTLRKSLEIMQRRTPFKLQWMRLFYTYGEGQNPKSLLSQLDRALNEGQQFFKMSAGDQLRDYLPIETIARCFEWSAAHPNMSGVINCCSGKPVSVIDLVNQHLAKRARKIHLVRGHYPYPDYEPIAFWGVPEKLTNSGFIID
jgi:nucleoside-diphosphate-sugar epimerase